MTNTVDLATPGFERGRVIPSGIGAVDAKRGEIRSCVPLFRALSSILVVHVASDYTSVVLN